VSYAKAQNGDCTRSSWLPAARIVLVLIGRPPSTVEWTADDINSFSRNHAGLPKAHKGLLGPATVEEAA